MIPPVHVLDDWMGGLGAVTLHRCHCTTESYCAVTYLARRWAAYEWRAEDGIRVFCWRSRRQWDLCESWGRLLVSGLYFGDGEAMP